MSRVVWSVVIAAIALALWIYLAFVRAVPSGWVHVPLIVAVVCIVIAIVDGTGPARTTG